MGSDRLHFTQKEEGRVGVIHKKENDVITHRLDQRDCGDAQSLTIIYNNYV